MTLPLMAFPFGFDFSRSARFFPGVTAEPKQPCDSSMHGTAAYHLPGLGLPQSEGQYAVYKMGGKLFSLRESEPTALICNSLHPVRGITRNRSCEAIRILPSIGASHISNDSGRIVVRSETIHLAGRLLVAVTSPKSWITGKPYLIRLGEGCRQTVRNLS